MKPTQYLNGQVEFDSKEMFKEVMNAQRQYGFWQNCPMTRNELFAEEVVLENGASIWRDNNDERWFCPWSSAQSKITLLHITPELLECFAGLFEHLGIDVEDFLFIS
jgi:hypothetical protein